MLVTVIPVPATADAILNMALDPPMTTVSLVWLAPFVWASAAFIAVLALTRRPKADLQPHTPATVTALETAGRDAIPHAAVAWAEPTPILDRAAAARDRAASILRRNRNGRTPRTSTEANGSLDAE